MTWTFSQRRKSYRCWQLNIKLVNFYLFAAQNMFCACLWQDAAVYVVVYFIFRCTFAICRKYNLRTHGFMCNSQFMAPGQNPPKLICWFTCHFLFFSSLLLLGVRQECHERSFESIKLFKKDAIMRMTTNNQAQCSAHHINNYVWSTRRSSHRKMGNYESGKNAGTLNA